MFVEGIFGNMFVPVQQSGDESSLAKRYAETVAQCARNVSQSELQTLGARAAAIAAQNAAVPFEAVWGFKRPAPPTWISNWYREMIDQPLCNP